MIIQVLLIFGNAFFAWLNYKDKHYKMAMMLSMSFGVALQTLFMMLIL